MTKFYNVAPRSKISTRLIAYVVLSSSIITLFISAFQLYSDYTRELGVIQKSIVQIKDVHADSVAVSLWSLDKENLNTIVTGIQRLYFVKHIEVMEDGDTMLTTGEPPSEGDITNIIPLMIEQAGTKQEIGQLAITIDLGPVYLGLVDRGILILISNTIKTALVVLCMLVILHFVLIRHLTRINEYIDGFRVEKPSEPLKLNRLRGGGAYKDELDIVVRSVNAANKRSRDEVERIQKAETQVRDFAAVSADWFWEMDADFRFTYFSERYYELTGFQPEDVIGALRVDLPPAEALETDKGKWAAHIADLEAHRPFKNYTFAYPIRNGDILSVQISGKPIFDANNIFIGYRGTSTNISKRVLAENELQQYRENLEKLVHKRTEEVEQKAHQLEIALESEKKYSALQQQFVSLVSHEFRTPLSIIDGTTQRIIRTRDKITPDQLMERGTKIRNAVVRMVNLIDITLYAARLEAGKVEMNADDCALKDVIIEACEHHEDISQVHDIRLDLDALPDSIYADAKLLEHVFTNLLSNAIKYSPNATLIQVRGWTEDDHAKISVQDYGIGISTSDLEHMFERYFRAKTAVGYVGTGIGLSISKEFVTMHSGTIEVSSTQGEGSTFTVTLPIKGINLAS